MPKLGVRLEDDGKFPWKLESPEEVLRSIRERKANELNALLRKKESRFFVRSFTSHVTRLKQLDSELKQLEGWSKPPQEMFNTGEFGPTPEGATVPTHDASGKELAKSRRDKLSKLYEAQRRGHEKWLAAVKNDPLVLDTLRATIASLTNELQTLKSQTTSP